MKLLITLLSLFIFITACNSQKQVDSSSSNSEIKAEPAKAPEASGEANTEQDNNQAGIVEENEMCICTKDFRPVCGSNGQTYPNACQAGCEGIKEYTEGPCK